MEHLAVAVMLSRQLPHLPIAGLGLAQISGKKCLACKGAAGKRGREQERGTKSCPRSAVLPRMGAKELGSVSQTT